MLPSIALTGALRSGKDAVREYLAERYGYARFAFGDGIRDVCRRLYPEQFVDGKKPRSLLRGVGQGLRQFDEDVWVNDCFRKIDDRRVDLRAAFGQDTEYPVVITDLRQPNEYARCRAEGFVIIRIASQSGLRIQRAVESADTFVLGDLTHETEQYTDQFAVDYEIVNDGTLAELYTQIDGIMTRISAITY